MPMRISFRGKCDMSFTGTWNLLLLTVTTPHMSRPSCVRVPVLSKHTQSIDLDTLIARGLVQYILCFSRRFCATVEIKKYVIF